MPYSGNPPIHRGTKFAWARLNADALFLSLYAMFVGLSSIIEPSGPVIREIGYVSPSYYMVNCGYLVGGMLLIIALMREWVSAEVAARVLLCWSVGFQLGREVAAFGWWPEAIEPVAICAIVFLTTLLRFSVLLSRKGIVVHLPQRHSEDEDSAS